MANGFTNDDFNADGAITGASLDATGAITGASAVVSGEAEAQNLLVDPGASGDSYVQFDINNTGKFRVGVDDDDSDIFKVSIGSALGTNDSFTLTSGGDVRFPLTGAFLANYATDANNVTGNGTLYTIVPGNQVFDQDGGYNAGTGIYTAQITGRYLFGLVLYIGGIGAGHKLSVQLVTSNATYTLSRSEIINYDDSGFYVASWSTAADMDASDTAYWRINGTSGALTMDIIGVAGGGYTQFWGYLVC